jgi:hypothetical protein
MRHCQVLTIHSTAVYQPTSICLDVSPTTGVGGGVGGGAGGGVVAGAGVGSGGGAGVGVGATWQQQQHYVPGQQAEQKRYVNEGTESQYGNL